MNADFLKDAIAARASGEDLPGLEVAELEAELSGGGASELAELEALCGAMRAATPAPSAARRERAVATRPVASRRRLAPWLAAAVILLAAGVAATIAVSKLRNPPVPTPVSREIPKPVPKGPKNPLDGIEPSGRVAKMSQQVRDLMTELKAPPPNRALAGEGDIVRPDVLPGGSGTGTPESSWLGPVAAQAGFEPLAAATRLNETSLSRAAVIRREKDGPPVDALWLRYTGDGGEFVAVEIPASDAARTWARELAFPMRWRRTTIEKNGLLCLVASPSCNGAALTKLAAALEPLHK